MTPEGLEDPGLQKFIELIRSGANIRSGAKITPEQRAALLGDAGPFGDDAMMLRRAEPQLLPVPEQPRGFRVRLDLRDTKPPVWRRLDLPGDIALSDLHEVIQAAMGWTDTHLHRFRTGSGYDAPSFVTRFDVEEGEEGVLEDDVRLDQLLADKGDRLWYDYDFGDDWHHVLRVEKVLDAPPPAVVCLGGRGACPPEDCGGTWGYQELAEWVRGGCDEARPPGMFGSVEEARAWLPEDWNPDAFDLDEVNEQLTAATAEPVAVVEELASLLEFARSRGARGLREALAHPASHGSTEIDAEQAAELVEPFRVLLDVIGDGAALTPAGYLKPAHVEQIARRTGVTEWWTGKADREELTWPIAELRAAARALGLVSVRKGRIAPTRAAAAHGDDPQALLRHIIGRLPLGKATPERHSGWAALAVAASETPGEQWNASISGILFELGWRDAEDPFEEPSPESPTFEVLRLLAGAARTGHRRLQDVNRPVAAVARAVVRA